MRSRPGLQRYAPVKLFRCEKSLKRDELEAILRSSKTTTG
jgi:hypothetical protein